MNWLYRLVYAGCGPCRCYTFCLSSLFSWSAFLLPLTLHSKTYRPIGSHDKRPYRFQVVWKEERELTKKDEGHRFLSLLVAMKREEEKPTVYIREQREGYLLAPSTPLLAGGSPLCHELLFRPVHTALHPLRNLPAPSTPRLAGRSPLCHEPLLRPVPTALLPLRN